VIGRKPELDVMREAWEQVMVSGERQVVALTGEAGIGKSRLVERVVATGLATGGANITLSCSSLHRDSPLRPVSRALARFFQASRPEEDTYASRLEAIKRRLELLPNRRVATDRAVP